MAGARSSCAAVQASVPRGRPHLPGPPPIFAGGHVAGDHPIPYGMADTTIVIPARNEGPLLDATLASLWTTPAGASFEVIVVDDGSRPPVRAGQAGGAWRLLRTAGEGAAAARNRGAAVATADTLCFCDAHITFTPGWLRALLHGLEVRDAVCPGVGDAVRPKGAGYGFTWNARCETRWLPPPSGLADVPFLPGACLLVRRGALAAVAGFDAGLVPWGYEDAELSWALWLAGFRCAVQPTALIHHHFRRRHPYLVLQEEVDRNLLRVGCVHFGKERLGRLATRLGASSEQLRQVYAAAASRRRWLGARKREDDNWLCARFGLAL